MIVHIDLRTDLDLPSTITVDEEGLAALALQLQLTRLYEQGDLSIDQATEVFQLARRQFRDLLDQYTHAHP